MKSLLIIGSEGFTGRYFKTFLKERCLLSEFKLLAADVLPSGDISKDSEQDYFDISDTGALDRLIESHRPEYLVNLAGLIDKSDFKALATANVILPFEILQSVVDSSYQPEKILLIGSAAEYGETSENPISEDTSPSPGNFYGLSKAMQSLLFDFYRRTTRLPIVLARTFNITGEGLSRKLAFGSFEKQIREAPDGGEILVGNIESQRDVLPIEEVVERYWHLLHFGRPGEIYNICSGNSTSIAEILQEMVRKSGKNLSIRIDPHRFQDNDASDIYGDTTKFEGLRDGS